MTCYWHSLWPLEPSCTLIGLHIQGNVLNMFDVHRFNPHIVSHKNEYDNCKGAFKCIQRHHYNHRMNHTCILIRVGIKQTWMVNQLKVGLVWHVWLDWLWSILWAKFVMKTNEKRKKNKKKSTNFSLYKRVRFQTFECLHEHEYYVLWLQQYKLELSSSCLCATTYYTTT